MTFIVQKHRLITISNEENAYILQRMHRNLELEPGQSLFGFLFEALYRVTDEYFPLVEEINRERAHSLCQSSSGLVDYLDY